MENKLMMKLTAGSEAIFFLALIMAYLFFWRTGNFANAVVKNLDIKFTAACTLLLVSSSISFWLAEKQQQKKNHRGMMGWLAVTIALGTIFLAGQGKEYYSLLNKNISISRGEFGSSFFALTGFHALHVLAGLLMLLILLGLSMAGYLREKNTGIISVIGIYWHFVDIVWLVVFTVIYVFPYLL